MKREEIDDFEKDYQEKKRLKIEQKRIEREKYYTELGQGVYDTDKFKNRFQEKYQDELRMKKAEEERQVEEINKKHDKMLSYAKIVKEMHWPEVSEKKKKELKEKKLLLENRNKKLRSPRMSPEKDTPQMSARVPRPKKKLLWNSKNTMRPPSDHKREGYVVDYLQEKRQHRQELRTEEGLEGDVMDNPSHNWKTLTKNDQLDS